jgi:tRNA(Arg) A34 adenosine deaminase TadA
MPAGRRVLWVTLEPCVRCAQAIQRFGVDEVVYVLDDPFRGGKALLAQAGIKLSKRDDWESATLQRVMDFFAREQSGDSRCFLTNFPSLQTIAGKEDATLSLLFPMRIAHAYCYSLDSNATIARP